MGLFDIFRSKTAYEEKLCHFTKRKVMRNAFIQANGPVEAALILVEQKIVVTAKSLFDILNQKYKLQEPQQIRVMRTLCSFLCSIADRHMSFLSDTGFNIYFVAQMVSIHISPSDSEKSETKAYVRSRLSSYLKAVSERRSTFEIVAGDLSVSITNAENPMLDLETSLLGVEMLSFILASENVLLSLKSSLDEIAKVYEGELQQVEWES